MSIENIPLTKLKISEQNVRKEVGDVSELAQSIAEKGVLQPLLVRPENGKYGIIIGSRRYSAAKQAKVYDIPSTIREMNDDEAMTISLVENLQRGDLQPKETAEAFALLLKNGLSVRDLAKKVGKSKTYIQSVAGTVQILDTLDKNNIRTESYPTDDNRRSGKSIPMWHVSDLADALEQIKHDGIHEITDDKIVEVAKGISPLPEKETQKVLKEFKNDPTKPITEVIFDVQHPDLNLGGMSFDSRDEIEVSAESETSSEMNGKFIYNLNRINEEFDFYTIGYANSSVEHFIERLEAKKVKMVIDTRNSVVSFYKPEFNGDVIKKELQKKGIKYSHMPELGVPKERRQSLSSDSDYKTLWKWYDKNVIPTLNVNIKSTKIAFMCRELDPTHCHRHRIAAALESKGMKSLDL